MVRPTQADGLVWGASGGPAPHSTARQSCDSFCLRAPVPQRPFTTLDTFFSPSSSFSFSPRRSFFRLIYSFFFDIQWLGGGKRYFFSQGRPCRGAKTSQDAKAVGHCPHFMRCPQRPPSLPFPSPTTDRLPPPPPPFALVVLPRSRPVSCRGRAPVPAACVPPLFALL